jgi:tetratricopeptide (TPR) repeat protein
VVVHSRQLVVLCIAALIAVPAAAVEPSSGRGARDAYQQGSLRYERGDYAQAITYFWDAYEQKPAPLLLFDIAQGYRLQKDYQRALEMYRIYLGVLPNAPNREDAHALIDETRALLDRQLATAPPPAPAPAGVVATPPPAPAPRRGLDARGWNAVRIAGIVGGCAGVAGLAAGAWLAARQASVADELAALRARGGPWDAAAQARYEDGRASATAANALFATGAVLVGGGGVMAIVGTQRRARAHTFAVAPARGGAGMSWTVEF